MAEKFRIARLTLYQPPSPVRTAREIIDRILLSPGRGEGRVRGIKRDSYFSNGPKSGLLRAARQVIIVLS